MCFHSSSLTTSVNANLIVVVDLEPIVGALRETGTHSEWDTNPSQCSMDGQLRASLNSRIHILARLGWEDTRELGGTPPETQRKHTELHSECNPSSGLNWGREVEKLPAVPLCCPQCNSSNRKCHHGHLTARFPQDKWRIKQGGGVSNNGSSYNTKVLTTHRLRSGSTYKPVQINSTAKARREWPETGEKGGRENTNAKYLSCTFKYGFRRIPMSPDPKVDLNHCT